MRKFACPQCKALVDDMKEMWKNWTIYKVVISDDDTEWQEVETVDAEHIQTWHDCGDGWRFETEEWTAEEFIVEIENGEIVDWGGFYETYEELLHDIAKKHNLKIRRREDAR